VSFEISVTTYEDNIKRNLREVEMKEKAVFVFNYAPHHEDVVVK